MSYLRMKGITKVYWVKELIANDHVDLEVEENEIHAVVGENGAGKTTLMKILYGLEQPDDGEILLREKKVEIQSPLDANELGIGMVHQHFKLIPDFTVSENVILGVEPRRNGLFVDRARANKSVKKVIDDHGFSINPKSRIRDLTVGQMQQVEIVKMLYRKTELIILDEPTSVLTEQEIHSLFKTLRMLVRNGKTCILITHKLREVMEISDRVTVMRKGKIVAVRNTEEVDRRELSRLMVGKSVLFEVEKAKKTAGAAVLELKNVSILQGGQDRPVLDNINLCVRSCEIVGIAGISGNGVGELEDVIAGLRKVTKGEIIHDGKDVTGLNTLELRENGLSYVPADRLFRGSSLNSTVRENLIISKHHDFINGGVFKNKAVREFTEVLIEQFSIDGTDSMPIGMLSGGNIQKVILARELASNSDLIVFSEPTWGLDIASSQFVYEKILEMRENGAAILLISSNLDELLALADTVVVLYRGRVVCNLPNTEKPDKEMIGEYMLGLRDDYLENQHEKT